MLFRKIFAFLHSFHFKATKSFGIFYATVGTGRYQEAW